MAYLQPNYLPQQQQQPNQMYYRPVLRGFPVSSIEEVRAAAIDFDGSTFVFPDIANKRIYTKQINVDGTATLQMYQLTDLPVDKHTTYVPLDLFDNTIKEIKEALQTLIKNNDITNNISNF